MSKTSGVGKTPEPRNVEPIGKKSGVKIIGHPHDKVQKDADRVTISGDLADKTKGFYDKGGKKAKKPNLLYDEASNSDYK